MGFLGILSGGGYVSAYTCQSPHLKLTKILVHREKNVMNSYWGGWAGWLQA